MLFLHVLSRKRAGKHFHSSALPSFLQVLTWMKIRENFRLNNWRVVIKNEKIQYFKGISSQLLGLIQKHFKIQKFREKKFTKFGFRKNSINIRTWDCDFLTRNISEQISWVFEFGKFYVSAEMENDWNFFSIEARFSGRLNWLFFKPGKNFKF